MEVVGYSYDADVHCVKCTMDAARELDVTEYVWGDYEREDYQDMHGHLDLEKLIEDEIIRDSENNPIHPIFDTDEAGDTPEHCSDCGEYIDTSWHEGTVDYAVEALADYVVNDSGSPEVLDIWADHLQFCNISIVDEAVLAGYRTKRNVTRLFDKD